MRSQYKKRARVNGSEEGEINSHIKHRDPLRDSFYSSSVLLWLSIILHHTLLNALLQLYFGWITLSHELNVV